MIVLIADNRLRRWVAAHRPHVMTAWVILSVAVQVVLLV